MKIGKNVLVTGGAGFIGSHLVDRLLKNHNVTVYDNLSSGKKEFVSQHFDKKKFSFIEADLLDMKKLSQAMREQDFVFHFAANSDVRLGSEFTEIPLKQNTIATYNVLESMRVNNVKNILFPSSCTVYGETNITSIPENYGPMIPISLYGASKLASEGLITAYCSMFDMNTWIFRFANIVGSRGTHGVIFDFINKLRRKSDELEILGDGKQTKSYLHIDDCLDAMLFAVEKTNDKVNIFNLGSDDWVNVDKIANIVVEEMNRKNVKFRYTGGTRGWKGDIPKIMLSIKKIKSLGWKPRYNSENAVRMAVKPLIKEVG